MSSANKSRKRKAITWADELFDNQHKASKRVRACQYNGDTGVVAPGGSDELATVEEGITTRKRNRCFSFAEAPGPTQATKRPRFTSVPAVSKPRPKRKRPFSSSTEEGFQTATRRVSRRLSGKCVTDDAVATRMFPFITPPQPVPQLVPQPVPLPVPHASARVVSASKEEIEAKAKEYVENKASGDGHLRMSQYSLSSELGISRNRFRR